MTHEAKFTEGFDSYVCDGDTITTEHDGIEYTAMIAQDMDASIDDDDCHNPDQSVTECNDEQQKNRPRQANCKTYPGVDMKQGRWRVRIGGQKKKRTELGSFNSLLDAVAAKMRAEREMGYHQNHGRSDFA